MLRELRILKDFPNESLGVKMFGLCTVKICEVLQCSLYVTLFLEKFLTFILNDTY